MKRPLSIAGVLSGCVMLLAGCGGADDAPAAARQSTQQGTAQQAQVLPVGLPAGLFLEAQPENSQGVAEAKREAKAGDRVVIRGRIGGSRDPFVDNRAVMTIVDMQLPTCADKPDDCCATPWDYCCEPRSEVVANAATVQIAGEGGAPLRTGLNGAGGLAPMAEVIVVGQVADAGHAAAFVVEAEGIYIVR